MNYLKGVIIMNLSKSLEYFNPNDVKGKIHIIGCGSVGSTLAENLARCGLTEFVLWDFDIVEKHNIVNQMFDERHIGKKKTEALLDILGNINSEILTKTKVKEGWNGELLSGYVFLCVDSIEIRKAIVEKHMNTPMIKAVFDFRTLLESAQHYAADWTIQRHKEDLINTMQFTHEEAMESTPVSACGVTLGVCTTVRGIVAIGVANFIRFIKGQGIKKLVLFDLENFYIDAF